MKKYLIVGLGNIGNQYQNTRHNIGFSVLDQLALEKEIEFETKKLADVAQFKHKGRTFILVKPNTFMNLSGKAVKYWMEKENIPLENILIITDDLNLPFGSIRIKTKGSAGGHNGIQNIIDILQKQNFPRLRFGVGSEFSKGKQVNFVLDQWNDEEQNQLKERIEKMNQSIHSFGLAGVNTTMNMFNGK